MQYQEPSFNSSSRLSSKAARSSKTISAKFPPDFTFQKKQVIQAAFRPAQVRMRTHGYEGQGIELRNMKFVPKQDVLLSSQMMIIIDDDVDVWRGEGDEKQRWYECLAEGVKDPFWLNADLLTFPQPDYSFLQLMDMFEECWNGFVFEKAKYKRSYDTVQKNLYSMYVKKKTDKPRVPEAVEIGLAEEFVKMFLERAEDRGMRLSIEGKKAIYYNYEQLKKQKKFGHMRDYFMNIYGRSEADGASRDKSAPHIRTQKVPYKFDIYLNVKVHHLKEVAHTLMRMMDDPEVLGELCVKSMAIAPLVNHASRVDSIVIRIVNPEGFEKAKQFLIEYVAAHPDYFIDDCLALTERFAPGASWSQDSWFSNVWDMDERMLAEVGYYLDEVSMKLSERKRNKPFFEWKSTGKQWEELEKMHRELQLQLVKKGGSSDQFDQEKLLKLGEKSEEVSKVALPYDIGHWIRHFKRYKKRYGADRKTFMGIRSLALEELALRTDMPDKRRYKNKMEAFKNFMRILRRHGIDLFHPHVNRDIRPVRDDGMVVIGEGAEELVAELGTDISHPEAMFVPTPAKPNSREKLTHTEEVGFEIPSINLGDGSRKPEDSLSKVYVQESVGAPRQVLKAIREEAADWMAHAVDQRILAKELEEERDEL
ncbi:hypothetical protein [Aureibacter tunicatorum]|uniref:Uncharacterized protein n=1 Tax=Aureibacter tunicatorum TaxID=866807 RepID=A0AAE4BNT2_9BACT|nr:hypothetical protein [Aureibacter tunicatorum]MDR6237174.1 hypothetical protein [Aureibacter tunicatorum]BDD06166.1 hypothetical protein AUTU_36490 [Aureibacter tunicatorum]